VAKAVVARKPNGHWIGSGNPGGRRKSSLRLQELCRSYTREAVEALVRAMKRGNVIAAREILDRGWGRAPMKVEGGERPVLVDFRWADNTSVQQVGEEALAVIEGRVEELEEVREAEGEQTLIRWGDGHGP
jgi:hypothetical protein